LLGIVAGLMLMSCLVGYRFGSPIGSPITAEEGSSAGSGSSSSTSDVRACTFGECERGGCDVGSAPFLCVDPKTAYYGCSALPWDGDVCANSCDMETCSEAKPAEGQESCAGVQCPSDRCASDTTYQRCGAGAPYQCLKGSSAMGCSDDPYGWVLVDDVICSSCCDDSAC